MPINQKKIKNIYIACFVFFMSLSAYASVATDTLYNSVKTTEYANKYSELKYEEYPEPVIQEKQVVNVPQTNFLSGLFSSTIFWIFCFIALVLLIYFLSTSKRFGFFTNKQQINARKILDAENYVDELDFDYLIKKALEKEDKQAAIRFYFLKTLKILTQKNYIKWESYKTNSDYYYEIQNPALKKDFDYARYLYTYIWFGKFTITDQQFVQAKNHFESIYNTLY